MTPVGFEPTPLRTGALSQRLRPLGQSVLVSMCEFPGTYKNDLPSNGPCRIGLKCKPVTSSYKNKLGSEDPSTEIMTPVGFEPTHPKIVELESTALDHSAKVSMPPLASKHFKMYVQPCSRLVVAAAPAGRNAMRQRSFRRLKKCGRPVG
jgi:hypothetical protein